LAGTFGATSSIPGQKLAFSLLYLGLPVLSFFETIARNMSLAGALAQGDTSGNAKNPQGHRNGMVNGTNVGGWSFPPLQAGLSAIQIISAVGLSPKQLVEKIAAVTKQGQRVVINKVDKAALKMVDQLVQDVGQFELAQGFEQVGTIMPFSMGQKVTAGLESKFQAHKIFEKRAFERFNMEGVDNAPSVILTDLKHQEISAELAKRWKGKENTMTREELRQIYKEVYATRPEWLKAIESYLQ